MKGSSERRRTDIQQLAPLAVLEVGARRVVTRGMQQHHGARRQAIERSEHGVESHPAGRRVEIGIALEPQAAVREQRHVVGPGGCAHMHDGIGGRSANELRTQLQRAASARRLDGAQAARGQRRVPLPQHQARHRFVEPGVADRRNVGFRRLPRQHLPLRLANRTHDGSLSGVIAEHADAQIHLARVRIGAKGGHHAENGVRRQPVEMLEHVFSPAVAARQEIEFTRPAPGASGSARLARPGLRMRLRQGGEQQLDELAVPDELLRVGHGNVRHHEAGENQLAGAVGIAPGERAVAPAPAPAAA